MKGLTVYRALTFILLPIAAFMGVNTLLALAAALINPFSLVGVFMTACIVIYTFTSFRFLNKGIERGQHCNASLKDWIKVNAFGSLIMVLIVFLIFGLIVVVPKLFFASMKQALAMQNDAMPASMSPESFVQELKKVIYYSTGFSVLLLIHILFTFRFLKRYAHLFDSK